MDLNLLGVENPSLSSDERLKSVKRAFSHYKSLEQCRRFFHLHPWIEPVIYSDTASAAQMVADRGDPTLAAIASLEAARLYGLGAIKRQIQNHPQNVSRFAIVSPQSEPTLPRGLAGTSNEPFDKATLLLNLSDHPYALLDMLNELKKHNVRVSRIDSKPLRHDVSDYTLSIDIELPVPSNEQALDQVLAALRAQVVSLKLVGAYHRANNEGWKIEPNL